MIRRPPRSTQCRSSAASDVYKRQVWVGKDLSQGQRRYIVHWATYDSKTNVPVVYLMVLDDTGSRALPTDERRWPRVQDALMAQSLSELKLLTIAKGFDEDFDNLHPKSLRRFHLGPMHSHAFTEQHGPIRNVLAEALGEEGLDWALAWTCLLYTSPSPRD